MSRDSSIFLEGLQTARSLVAESGDFTSLDALIAEHESGSIETTAIRPMTETR